MSKCIWKYPIFVTDSQLLMMPSGAVVRHVGKQNGRLYLWAEVDPEAPDRTRRVNIAGTGRRLVDNPGAYLGTVDLDQFVWHIFIEEEQ